jgi:hypothetical protein
MATSNFPRYNTGRALQAYAQSQKGNAPAAAAPKPASKMPRGAEQSPKGDLGALRAKEAKAVFPGRRPKRGPDSARVCTAR